MLIRVAWRGPRGDAQGRPKRGTARTGISRCPKRGRQWGRYLIESSHPRTCGPVQTNPRQFPNFVRDDDAAGVHRDDQQSLKYVLGKKDPVVIFLPAPEVITRHGNIRDPAIEFFTHSEKFFVHLEGLADSREAFLLVPLAACRRDASLSRAPVSNFSTTSGRRADASQKPATRADSKSSATARSRHHRASRVQRSS